MEFILAVTCNHHACWFGLPVLSSIIIIIAWSCMHVATAFNLYSFEWWGWGSRLYPWSQQTYLDSTWGCTGTALSLTRNNNSKWYTMDILIFVVCQEHSLVIYIVQILHIRGWRHVIMCYWHLDNLRGPLWWLHSSILDILMLLPALS